MYYIQKPLIKTRYSKLINDQLPYGINVIVAIATYGYNQKIQLL